MDHNWGILKLFVLTAFQSKFIIIVCNIVCNGQDKYLFVVKPSAWLISSL